MLSGVQLAASSNTDRDDYWHEWAVQADRYGLEGTHAVHIVITDDSGAIQVFINGREATFLRTTTAGLGQVEMYGHSCILTGLHCPTCPVGTVARHTTTRCPPEGVL